MALSFSVVHTTTSRLWDYGWFDLTLFAVDGPPIECANVGHILEQFLRSPISQRSFCSPGPWGEPVQRHGPYIYGRLVPEWFRPVALRNSIRVRDALDDPKLRNPLEADQRMPVETWGERVAARGDKLFTLDPPSEGEVRVDWDWVWKVYHEFATISLNGHELSVGVIGYD